MKQITEESDVPGSMHRKRIFMYNQQDATLHNLFIFCEMLYMFQAVPPPIIRSSKLYVQHQVLCQTLLLPATVVPTLPQQWQVAVKVGHGTRCCMYSFELLMMGIGTT